MSATALAGVIACIGELDFATRGLERLNQALCLGWWSVYQLFDQGPPVMHLSASFGVADGTLESWQAYRSGLYRRDRTFAEAKDVLDGSGQALMHWHAHEMPAPQRAQIYTRHRLRERVSLIHADAQGLLAVNVYRHEAHPRFNDGEVDLLRALGLPLLACVRRHLQDVAACAKAAPADESGSVLDGLPRREREVCERLLRGWTHEGVAADLCLSPATVKTYRDRAFERLGIHHRNELFARAIGRFTKR